MPVFRQNHAAFFNKINNKKTKKSAFIIFGLTLIKQKNAN
jgi:hypothetical protein